MSDTDTPARLGEAITYGKVESIDLPAGRILVRVGDIVTDKIRWLTGGAGESSIWFPPSVGEQVLVFAPEGDLTGAIAIRGVISTAFPAAGNSTRALIKFGDGAVLAYDPEGHALDAILPAGATVRIDADGGISLKGDVAIDGDVDVTGDVKAGGISLKNHLHGKVQAGAAKTDKPE